MNLIFIILLILILYFLIGRIFYIPTPADELHFAETADGWHISLYRYIPSQRKEGREPVILCHGLSANRYTFDFDQENSLARYLRDQGFDCWVVELRGRGMSRYMRKWRWPWGWRFDDYLQHDLPAVIRLVKETTQSASVHWIGHSMGGMLMYAYLGSVDQDSIQSLCAIGSPARFTYSWYPGFMHGVSMGFLNIIPVFFNRFFARFAAPFVLLFNTSRFGYHRGILPRFLSNGISNVSSNVLKQFMEWIETGGFFSHDRRINYQDNLGRITRPFLLVAGSMDWAATPGMCKFTYEKISSKDKQLIVFGKRGGHKQDYDHLALILGMNARQEVFPTIRDFLEKHSSA